MPGWRWGLSRELALSGFWPEEVQAVLSGNFAEEAKTERKRAMTQDEGVGMQG